MTDGGYVNSIRNFKEIGNHWQKRDNYIGFMQFRLEFPVTSGDSPGISGNPWQVSRNVKILRFWGVRFSGSSGDFWV